MNPYSDLPRRYCETISWIVEYQKVLSVFWSKIPLSRVHGRLLNGRDDLQKQLPILLEIV